MHVVRKYARPEEYLEGPRGEAMGEFKTWEEAEVLRNRLRSTDPEHYYNITHTTKVAVITVEECKAP